MVEIDPEVSAAVEAGEAVKERLKTDPDAVRKLLAKTVTIDEKVTIYPDKALNREYAEIAEKVRIEAAKSAAASKKQDGESNEDYLARTKGLMEGGKELEAEFESMRERLNESAVTFDMVSISKSAIKNLKKTARKKFPVPDPGEPDEYGDDREDYFKASIVAAHLIEDGYTVEDILTIMNDWPIIAFAELWAAATRLSIADDYLQEVSSPDF